MRPRLQHWGSDRDWFDRTAVRALEYSRVRTIRAPLLKVLRGYIEDTDPELKVSNQKIADALATFGVRIPRRRRRAA